MPTPKLQVFRKASFTPTPWKNGGGITHEAVRVPAAGDPFHWRMSVAHIDASGPFSDFAGYHRKMVLLQGAGLELRFGDGTRRTLRQIGDLVDFDGALDAHGELLNGPCVDLNLMVSKTAAAAARVERVTGSLAVAASDDETLVVFPIDRAITLSTEEGESVTLAPWDLAVLSRAAVVIPSLDEAAPATAVFVANIAS